MLNYMGPNFGSQPVAAGLPPATPGTIPAGVPGAQPNPAPLPPAPVIHSHAAPHNAALASILRHASAGPVGSAPAPAPPPKYQAITQGDGSILLHIQLPNGQLGPIVKVLPPIKHPLNPHEPPSLQKQA
jgi:hypothetical protein